MIPLAKFLVRSIGVWIILIGSGSFLFGSWYLRNQERLFREGIQNVYPDMDLREVLALSMEFNKANDGIMWIMAVSTVLWIGVVGLLAHALGKKLEASGEPCGSPKDGPASSFANSHVTERPSSVT